VTASGCWPIYRALGISPLHPVRHGAGGPPQGLRQRHHLLAPTRVRLRLPPRQHEAGPSRRRPLRRLVSARTSACRSTNAIIDEVDNILVDEARTPRSSAARPSPTSAVTTGPPDRRAAHRPQKTAPAKYYEVKEKEHTCHLTDEASAKARSWPASRALHGRHMEWPHLIDNASGPTTSTSATSVTPSRGTRTATMASSSSTSSRAADARSAVELRAAPGCRGQATAATGSRSRKRRRPWPRSRSRKLLQDVQEKLAGMTGTAMTEADEFDG